MSKIKMDLFRELVGEPYDIDGWVEVNHSWGGRHPNLEVKVVTPQLVNALGKNKNTIKKTLRNQGRGPAWSLGARKVQVFFKEKVVMEVATEDSGWGGKKANDFLDTIL